MDRVTDADDSGEVLFRYLRGHRPNINAFFVIQKNTPAWQRLRTQRSRRRVIAYGSLMWKVLLLNTKYLISSHADKPVIRPQAITNLATPHYRFIFLQHGVIKDDISRWLNNKPIRMFVTSTPDEHRAVAGDESPFTFTSREVKMTGLPRFDRLHELNRSTPESARDLILVAPTWRDWLNDPIKPGETKRAVSAGFAESEYALNWMGLLRSVELADIAKRHGKRIGFLPHFNLHEILDDLDLPDYVERLSFDGGQAQMNFIRAAIFVTDYSSMAFNAAYLQRPVVYFQFDADEMALGGHTGRPGYFDFKRDGFGPVTTTVDEAIAAIRSIADHGPEPDAAARAEAAFPFRDGKCCVRVVKEIERLHKPIKPRAWLRQTDGADDPTIDGASIRPITPSARTSDDRDAPISAGEPEPV